MTIPADQIPAQEQNKQPAIESEMSPKPEYDRESYKGSDKLKGKVALITGGDSGIGRSVAVLYAREGADVAIVYLSEHGDAEKTKKLVEAEGQKCLLLPGDISGEQFCAESVQKTVDELGRLDILVNNAAEQYMENPDTLEDIDSARLGSIFSTNIFAMFYFCKAAIPHLKEGSSIINTTSINAYKGNAPLLSYSTTKGAILAFTRSLSQSLLKKGIRVNGVAPSPYLDSFYSRCFSRRTSRGIR